MEEYGCLEVYEEGFDDSIKAMEGVSTSTAGFIGLTQRGPTEGKPILVTSFLEYQHIFGDYLPNTYKEQRYLPYSVEQFFQNGGSNAYIMRVCANTDTCAISEIICGNNILTLKAKNVGVWGNNLEVKLKRNRERYTMISAKCEREHTYLVKNAEIFHIGELVEIETEENHGVFYKILDINEQQLTLNTDIAGEYLSDGSSSTRKLYAIQYDAWLGIKEYKYQEIFNGVSLQKEMPNNLEQMLDKSYLVSLYLPKHPFEIKACQEFDAWICGQETCTCTFYGGTSNLIENDPSLYIGVNQGLGKCSGLAAFQEISDVSILCIPGVTMPKVQAALIDYCEKTSSCFAILDMPQNLTDVDELLARRAMFDSSYAAIYHPWLKYYDALEKHNLFFPPSGTMAGIYARCDHTRGVYKAPANEVIRGCYGLSTTYNVAEQRILNAKGVNLICKIPGSGFLVWGARTISSNSSWKYVNVRRLFIYIEESIYANTRWAVFETNDEKLWSRVKGTIQIFLTILWRNGALMGATAEEAFYVNIGRSTMTQDDIQNGRLICEIGVASIRPADFVILKIAQNMEKGHNERRSK